ncbi:MAG TPA: lysylphosphatidylglycerol synthase domain-containing protein [Acidimicrobiia bacterium]
MTAVAPNPSERHASDLIRLAAAALVLLFAWVSIRNARVGATEASLFRVINTLPGFLEDPFRIVEAAAIAAGVVVPLWALLARRLGLARDLVLAAVLSWGGAEVLERLAERGRPDGLVPDVELHGVAVSGLGFPAVTVAVAAGLATALSPYVTRIPRRIAWSLVLLVAVARVFVGAHLPVDAVAGWAVGVMAGSLVHVAFGSPGRRATLPAVRDALARAGLSVPDLAPLAIGRRGSTMFVGHDGDGSPVFCRAIGRDERDRDVVDKAWRVIALRDQRDQPFFTSLQAVEHEAYLNLLADRAGVATPSVRITAGFEGGAVLAWDRAPGTRLADLESDTIDDAVLDAIWNNLAVLRAARLSHGALSADNVFVADGGALFVDWAEARSAADERRQAEDVAELLVSLAVRVGPERSVAAAARALGAGALVPVLPLLQPTILSSATRREARAHKGLIEAVRAEGARVAGVEEPKLQPLTRVSPATLLSSLVLALAIYVLLPEFGELGEVWEAIREANYAWLAMALGAAMGTYVSGAVGQVGAIQQRIALTRMTVVQLAAAFASRITPASVGSLAVKVRFLQKSGLTNDEAVAGTALNSAGGGVARVVAIALALLLVGGGGFGIGDELPSGWIVLLLIVVGLAAVGIAVFTAIGRRLLKPVKRALGDLVTTLRNPRKGAMLLGGALGVIVLNTICFGLALAAVNAHVSLDTVIVVYVLGSTVGGAAPTPGGLGAVEAALVAGLTAAGTDPDLAVAGVLSFRFLTYWLPIPLGYLALHRLRNEGLL